MKLQIRRIGNSLGIIIPRRALAGWNLKEGSYVQLTEHGIRPPARAKSHELLDEHKRRLAMAVASYFSPQLIRAQGLANLHRWKAAGAWVSAHDEWQRILEHGSDGELFAVMLGRDERANRLRQSAPYVGLLPRDEVRKLNEEAAA
jgi:antitoxin component of MazEF toxin-antitoxin module